MIHYKYQFNQIDYDFKIPKKIFIVDCKFGWNFINHKILDLFLYKETYSNQNVIAFYYDESSLLTFFYPHEIVNKIINYIPADKFYKMKAFI